MYAKAQIKGTIELVTGLHIGGSSSFSAIGAVDSPIVKDIRNGHPVIPGSSLKGKMRALLAKQYNDDVARTHNEDHECITRLFGSSEKNNLKISRLLFSDMILSNWEDLKREGLTSKTEIKFENTINRLTSEANPRQIERAIRGSKFDLDLIYEIESEEEMKEDFEVLKNGFKLLQYDYLGGNGSRGYGKVKFYDLKLKIVVGDQVSKETVAICQELLDEVSKISE